MKKIGKTRLNIFVGIIATIFLGLDYLAGFAIFHFRELGWLIPKPTAFLLHHWFLPFLTFFVLLHILLSFDNYFLIKRIKDIKKRRLIFWPIFLLFSAISICTITLI